MKNIPVSVQAHAFASSAINVLLWIEDADSVEYQDDGKIVLSSEVWKNYSLCAQEAISMLRQAMKTVKNLKEEQDTQEEEKPKKTYDPDDPERCTKLIRDLPTGLNYEDAR